MAKKSFNFTEQDLENMKARGLKVIEHNEPNKNTNLPDRHRESRSKFQERKEVSGNEGEKAKANKLHRPKGKRKDGGDNISVKASVLINFRVPDHRRQDNDGALCTAMDMLVHAGIIADDSRKYIQRSAIGSSIEKQPGADIVIIEFID